jgi:hypothetical protein
MLTGLLVQALEAAARHTITIADAHRRDIDRVCRESTCASVLTGLVERTAAQALEERRVADTKQIVAQMDKNLVALKSEMVKTVIPREVKEEVNELMTLKVLPLQYTFTDLQHNLSDLETQVCPSNPTRPPESLPPLPRLKGLSLLGERARVWENLEFVRRADRCAVVCRAQPSTTRCR